MLNCQRLQYEILFILCSCKIESSERKRLQGNTGIVNLRSGSIFVSLCNNVPAGKAILAVAVRENV